MRRSFFLIALLLGLPVIAAELVAPRPMILGPSPMRDSTPASLTNGSTTLVTWVNEYSPYASTWSIHVGTLDSPESGWWTTGFGPILATNGNEYLLAFSMAGSRFMLHPVDNVGVRLVSSDGTPAGPPRSLNRSMTGFAGGGAWNGERWLVGYTSDESAHVALLDSALDRAATAELGSGRLVDLAMIGRRAWAFVVNGAATEAIEILPTGGIGARHSLVDRPLQRVVPTTAGALAFARLQNGVIAIPFDPVAGFGTAREVASEGTLRGVVPWEGGAAVLVTGSGGSSIRAVTPAGEMTATQSLGTSSGAGLGEWRDGLLYFESREDEQSGTDIYGYRLQSLQIAGPAELVSVINLAWQTAPVIASTGEGAIAFWSERVNQAARVRSRAIDAAGRPFGPIAALDAIPTIDDLSFDGDRFFAVWASLQNEIYAAAISRDGVVAGEPMRIGDGVRPAIASSGGATFVVWRTTWGVLRGVNLRADGSPVVPGGSQLLPAFGETESSPKITAIREGFFVGWTVSDVRAVVLSPSGTVLRGYELGVQGFSLIDVASRGSSALGLVTGPEGSLLYALDGGGRPFASFDPWAPWFPHSVIPIAENRYLVAFARVRGGELLTSEITMDGARIAEVGPLRRLGPAESVAVVGETPVALFIDDGVWVSTLPESDRRRAVARRKPPA